MEKELLEAALMDIKKMIKELVNILRYRTQYFMQYSDEINGNIRRYISENSTITMAQLPSLGGDANISLSRKNKDIIESSHKEMKESAKVYLSPLSWSSNKNPANIYESKKIFHYHLIHGLLRRIYKNLTNLIHY